MIAAALLFASVFTGGEFPVLVWRQEYSSQAPPVDLIAPFGGVNVEGADDAAWVFERGYDFYVGHAPGRNALHLERDYEWYAKQWNEFFETRDISLLVREPSLADPRTLASLKKRIDRSLAARRGRNGLCVSLGDEVGLTPWGDPLDLCQSEFSRAAWSEFARRERERLRAPDGEPPAWLKFDGEVARYVSTDEARLAFNDGDVGPLSAWLLQRRFNRGIVTDLLAELAGHVRMRDDDARVSLFGVIASSAFGGVSIPALLPFLDVLECYSASDSREVFHTLREDEESWVTIFPAAGDSDRAAHRLWEHWLRGGDAAIVWSDRELMRSETYASRLARAVRDVRRMERLVPDHRPAPAGIAFVHSPDSVALSWMRDALTDGPTWPRRFQGHQEEHGTRERSLRTWLRLAEDLGTLPGSLPFEHIGADTVERFGTLVLLHQWIVEEADEARLIEYLEAGGRVVLVGPFARMRRLGESAADSLAKELRERFEERVFVAPETLPDYLAVRETPQHPRARTVREFLLAASDTAPLDWEPVARGVPLPWLRSESMTKDGERVCVALPNLLRGKQERLLEDLEVRIETEHELRWLHPREGHDGKRARVRAGDAVVFILEN